MTSNYDLASGLPERRVQPILDEIHSGQFKKALKLIKAIISKYPRSPYAFALKAQILEKMGKPDEALLDCLMARELLNENESLLEDEIILDTIGLVFLRLDQLKKATGLYELACGKFPNNLELMWGLFNCYILENSFVKQQETAMKMYELNGTEFFLLLAVGSIQLQVLFGNGEENLLVLAEDLLKKHAASYSLNDPEVVIMYISILEKQAKYGDALEILEGKLGSVLVDEIDKLRIKGKLLARAGDYSAAANVYEKILELRADDWEAFLHYLGCLLEDDSSWSNETTNAPIHPSKFVECKLTHLTDEVFDTRVLIASTFVQKLHEEPSALRNQYLARLEIERRKCLFGKNNCDHLIEVILQYYAWFGHLACFSFDVEAFLQVLSTEKKMEFLDKMTNHVKALSEASKALGQTLTLSDPFLQLLSTEKKMDYLDKMKKNANMHPEVSTKALGKSITFFKTQELIGNLFRLSVVDLEGLALQMAELFCKNLSLSKDLDPHETMHGEELLSLVCNVLVQLFWRTRNVGYFIEAIIVLEFGLTIRRYVGQYKILLLHLYAHFGALSLAYERYKSLDVTSILMETSLHHILPQMLLSPFWSDLGKLLIDYLKFMGDHLRSYADLVLYSYREKKCSKVIEFFQFKERLISSNQYFLATIEAPILQLKQSADNIEEVETILERSKDGLDFVLLSDQIGSISLTFNEDFQSRPWWTPTTEKNHLLGPFEGISDYPKEKLMKEREVNVRRIIKGRFLLPRMIYLSIQNASVLYKDKCEVKCSIADPNLSSELETLLELYANMLGFSLNDAIDVVVGVSRGLKSYQVFGSDVIAWFNFAVFLNAWNLNSHVLDGGGRTVDGWHLVNSLLEGYILEKVKTMEPLIQSPQADFPILFQLISEPLAWHELIIQSCARLCLPSEKKKKKSGSAKQYVSSLSLTILDAIQWLCGILEEVEKWLKDQINSSEDKKLDSLMSSVQRNGQDEGPGKVFHILQTLMSSINETELGSRISQALRSWSSADVGRNIIWAQNKQLYEFCDTVESKRMSLIVLKQKLDRV